MYKHIALLGLALALSGCANDARVARENLKQEADSFKILRRIVFYNGITNDYMLTIEGYCSQEQDARKFIVTCKAPDGFKNHFLYLSDNVTYISEQLSAQNVSTQHYKFIFKPSVVIPTVEVK